MNPEQLEDAFVARFPAEAAHCLEALPPEAVPTEAAGLSPASLRAVLDRLTPSQAAALYRGLRFSERVEVVRTASPGLAVNLALALDDAAREELLNRLPAAARGDLERFLDFPADSAARLMDREAPTAPDHLTVGATLDRLRRTTTKPFSRVWILGEGNRLTGGVDFKELAFANRSDILRAHAAPVAVSAHSLATREDVAHLLEAHRADAVPVVDAEGRFLGVVRHDRLLSVVEDTATAGLQRMVGASSEERALSGAWFAVTHRLPWLHINLLTAFLAASVVALFEGLIAQFTALAVLLPVVAGQSGNAGAQALAVTMRGLALREIGIRDWRRVLRKEVLTGAVNGAALAVTCGAGVWFWSGTFGLGLIIAVSMVLSMVAAGIAGALVPLALTRFGRDPATASSIIQTTITDVAGFLSFLGVASLLAFLLSPSGST